MRSSGLARAAAKGRESTWRGTVVLQSLPGDMRDFPELHNWEARSPFTKSHVGKEGKGIRPPLSVSLIVSGVLAISMYVQKNSRN